MGLYTTSASTGGTSDKPHGQPSKQTQRKQPKQRKQRKLGDMPMNLEENFTHDFGEVIREAIQNMYDGAIRTLEELRESECVPSSATIEWVAADALIEQDEAGEAGSAGQSKGRGRGKPADGKGTQANGKGSEQGESKAGEKGKEIKGAEDIREGTEAKKMVGRKKFDPSKPFEMFAIVCEGVDGGRTKLLDRLRALGKRGQGKKREKRASQTAVKATKDAKNGKSGKEEKSPPAAGPALPLCLARLKWDPKSLARSDKIADGLLLLENFGIVLDEGALVIGHSAKKHKGDFVGGFGTGLKKLIAKITLNPKAQVQLLLFCNKCPCFLLSSCSWSFSLVCAFQAALKP